MSDTRDENVPERFRHGGAWSDRDGVIYAHPVAGTGDTPTLTDAERAAVEWAAAHLEASGWSAATLRSLLERLA